MIDFWQSDSKLGKKATPATRDVFTNTPPDTFGSGPFFDFCMKAPLTYEFPVAKWDGKVEHQVEKFDILMRHSVPLIWRQGVDNCEGLKVKCTYKDVDFKTICKELLKRENLQAPSVESINVKSAKIGQVSFKFKTFNFNGMVLLLMKMKHENELNY